MTTLNTRIKDALCELLHINGGFNTGWNAPKLVQAASRCGIDLTSRTADAYHFDDIIITKEDYDQWAKQNATKPHAD